MRNSWVERCYGSSRLRRCDAAKDELDDLRDEPLDASDDPLDNLPGFVHGMMVFAFAGTSKREKQKHCCSGTDTGTGNREGRKEPTGTSRFFSSFSYTILFRTHAVFLFSQKRTLNF